MSNLLEGGEHLEQELMPEPIKAPALGSLLLHAALLCGLLFYGMLNGFFKHNLWGNPGEGGAIAVTLANNAIPLPNDHPKNDNVLATEHPSEAPAPPQPKPAVEKVDEKAIPIATHVKPQEKPKKQNEQQPQPQTQKHQPPQKTDNRAHYGEMASASMPRSMTAQTTNTNGPVNISNGDFGSRFGWYVDVIKRKVAQNWYKTEVTSSTAKGATAQIYFRVNRQGQPSEFKVNKSSGSSTLDTSCLRATQRVDTFGPLPSASNQQWLEVTYDCTY